MSSGYLKLLSDSDIKKIHETALEILSTIGMGSPIPSCIQSVTQVGGHYENGRLKFPRDLVENTIANAGRHFVLPGQDPKHDLEPWGAKVYCGTAGAAISVVDPITRQYRDSTIADLYDLARLVDCLDNIQFFQRPVVARDLTDNRNLDVNTCYAAVSGTSKHVGSSWVDPEHVEESIQMLHLIAGGESAWRERPFVSMACTFVVPPLKFAEDSCRCLEVAVRGGMPVLLLSGPMVGATAPITLAGALAQSTAEILAGLVYVNALSPGHPAIFGCWGGQCDVRTGAMVVGCAEQGLFAAGAGQLAQFYDLPGAGMAGMSDSKIPDAQSGAEKASTLSLAAMSGVNLIYEAAGMQASLIGVCPESLVIDNDTIGMAMRAVRGIEVTEETLVIDVMRAVAEQGVGHYLGHPMTLKRMTTEHYFPTMFDRQSPSEWQEAGALDANQRASEKTRDVFSNYFPEHIPPELDQRIRQSFDIKIPAERMRAGQ
jgi:trimethylamine--corrinoid protein Co-methyltransferase